MKQIHVAVGLAATVLASVALMSQTQHVQAASSDYLPAMGQKAKVTYDRYSLMIDGKRTPITSGEAEYWRIPSYSKWRDVLEKMKASGFNAVTIYFDWAYHSPAKGKYDFTGIRDVNKFLDIAQDVGLYVIARPGPYINGESDAGGFPGWLQAEKGKARSSDPNYTENYMDWLSHIDPILKQHQITNGGNIIM